MSTTYCCNSVSLLLICFVANPSQFFLQDTATGFGTVQGRVIDDRGEPLPGAKVYAEPIDAKDAQNGKLRFTIADEKGNFVLEQVVAGVNLICASKEDGLYPDTGTAALATDLSALPRVVVGEGKVSDGILVRLVKGGKIVGSIVDSQTGEPVIDARLYLSRDDDPNLYISMGPDEQGHFEFVVPSKPFRLAITSAGYKPWKADGQGIAILVKPSTTKEFDVRLQSTNVKTPN